MTITEFLLARISEDEAAAREAIRMRDRVRPGYGPDWDIQAWDEATPAVIVGAERVLAECEAKRRIVGIAAPEWPHEDDRYTLGWSDATYYMFAALAALAAVYADHPDYDPAWSPT